MYLKDYIILKTECQRNIFAHIVQKLVLCLVYISEERNPALLIESGYRKENCGRILKPLPRTQEEY